jgi:hypothetical protein
MNPKTDIYQVLKPPFGGDCYNGLGSICDGNGHRVLDVRGWGTFGNYENGAELQDELAIIVAKLLTKHFEERE